MINTVKKIFCYSTIHTIENKNDRKRRNIVVSNKKRRMNIFGTPFNQHSYFFILVAWTYIILVLLSPDIASMQH